MSGGYWSNHMRANVKGLVQQKWSISVSALPSNFPSLLAHFPCRLLPPTCMAFHPGLPWISARGLQFPDEAVLSPASLALVHIVLSPLEISSALISYRS